MFPHHHKRLHYTAPVAESHPGPTTVQLQAGETARVRQMGQLTACVLADGTADMTPPAFAGL